MFTKASLLGTAASLAMIACPQAAWACGGFWDAGCNIKQDLTKAIDDTTRTSKKAIDDVAATAGKAASDAAATAKKSIDDTANASKKAVDDTVRATVKAASDVIDAGKAVERFSERQTRGTVDNLGAAQRRIREGKVVDAVWNYATDDLNRTNTDAAKAAQESQVLGAAAQGAATFYGGPAGAAAYAAWYAYNATGSVDLAIKAGVVSGLSSYGYASAAAMPAGTLGEVAKKAIVTGALGGVGVAAAGGDQDAVRDAFLKSSSMVLVQSSRSYVERNYVAPLEARADVYCMSAVGSTCATVAADVKREGLGRYALDAAGNRVSDRERVLPGREALGAWGDPRQQAVRFVSDEVAPSTVFTSDHAWAIGWDKDALTDRSSVSPGVVLTYTGEASPFAEKLSDLGAATQAATPPAAAPPSTDARADVAGPRQQGSWVAVGHVNTANGLFEVVMPQRRDPVQAGYVIEARRPVVVRSAPGTASAALRTLAASDRLLVSEVRDVVSDGGTTQTWAKVDGLDAAPDPVEAPSPSEARKAAGEQAGTGKGHEVEPADEPPPSAGVAAVPLFPMWCVDHERRLAFEVDSDLVLHGLTDFAKGTATKRHDGSIRFRFVRQTPVAPGLPVSWEEAMFEVVRPSGKLFAEGGGRPGASVGFCTTVAMGGLGRP